MQLGADDQEAYADKPYALTVGSETVRGRTDARGLVEEDIPPAATEATLRLFLEEGEQAGSLDWQLVLGGLDPPQTVSGAQARLNNLGFYCGDVSGQLDPRTREALTSFQLANNLPATGELDATTSDRLAVEHDKLG
jgi:type VI secretion system secreted protein VgrG